MLFKQFLSNKKKRQVLWIIIVLIISFFAWFSLKPKDPSSNLLKVPVKQGSFEISITTTGELGAKNSKNIVGPNTRGIGIYEVKIEHIVPNGTLVDSGDYIATLNKSDLLKKIKEIETEIDKLETKYITAKLDTTINLKSARNDLLNQKFGLEEIELELEQSIYETPATVRQIEIKLGKSKRTYEQAKASYKLKEDKAIASIKEVTDSKKKAINRLRDMHKTLNAFTIFAPMNGMVIHPKGYGKDKNIIGRSLNMHNPVVATLPNLQELTSKTYVNEIDISKLKKGQEVIINVDAFPDQTYKGFVTEIANMGNQLMSGNAKLFEVEIELKNKGNKLKPSMTTKNKIIIKTYENVMYIPLECIHNDEDMSFVYTEGGYKKQIVVGETNENEIIVQEGLSVGEKICLGNPEDPKNFYLIRLNDEILNKYEKKYYKP